MLIGITDPGGRGLCARSERCLTRIAVHQAFFADGLYIRVSDNAQLRGLLFCTAHIAVKDTFAEGFVGYRLINCQQGYLSLNAGVRYNYMSRDFRLIGARVPGPARARRSRLGRSSSWT